MSGNAKFRWFLLAPLPLAVLSASLATIFLYESAQPWIFGRYSLPYFVISLLTTASIIFILFIYFRFKRKAFLINTPKKIVNQNYLTYENKPIEITLRNILGKTYDIENIKEIASSIKILSQEEDKKKLIEEDDDVEEIISKNFFI